MRIASMFGTLFLGAALVIGCDDATTTTDPAPPPAKTGGNMMDKAQGAAADLKDQTAAAADKGKEMAGDAKDAVVKQAQDIYDKVKTAIADKKFDDASKMFDQLKGWKDKLPAEWVAKIDDLGKMLDSAKSMMPK